MLPDTPKRPKHSCFERAVELLNNAKKPVIYCGGGAVSSNVGDDLIKFAEKSIALLYLHLWDLVLSLMSIRFTSVL